MLAQTFRDFEVVFVHDGLKQVPFEKEFDLSALEKVKTVYTKERFNDWGAAAFVLLPHTVALNGLSVFGKVIRPEVGE